MATIGLFGTCGNSKWRESFKIQYKQHGGIKWYDPNVLDWKPENAIEEAEHLKNDDIILFPVTNETYGLGSLGETGFSILSAISSIQTNRYVVIMIDDNLLDPLKENTALYKESIKMRALIKAHLKKVENNNIFIVQNLDEMYYVSVVLVGIINQMTVLDRYRPFMT